jgi:hypothetical protein
MRSEILSTARPTTLRVAGFAAVVLGAIASGVGATRAWVSIGLAADVQHAGDLPVHGTDVWEGKVVLFAAAAALLVMIAMRISGSNSTRRGLAAFLIILGVASVALPLVVAERADDRFGAGEGLERYVKGIAAQVGLPEDVVRQQLEDEFDRAGRVEIEPGLWLGAAGGVLLAAGGVLGLAWVRRRETATAASGVSRA